MELFSQPCACLFFALQQLSKAGTVFPEERKALKGSLHTVLVVQSHPRLVFLAQRYLTDRRQEKFIQDLTAFVMERRPVEICFEESFQAEEQQDGPEMTLDPC